ncbi:hypothetical protein AMTRI_Chr05g63750 [Amborella trichopoda]|uniref:Pseudouridine synthase RsuA/RluA-like domain-containing protein n=1 Tax=Amborella trichopoda TaxID=13333 RepID=W1PAY1_AMBTC|nr:RNA pseudouridine synthase 3, mitochondrial [Amborella trichopoda]ERN04854.1 hypothetical protein AMTR_s00146p00072100 [Amborella trichopoda]|eukprot:XP_006843179.1 RNA pseudouridine synthase 3, mitochondrial [Amborella trichopoda]
MVTKLGQLLQTTIRRFSRLSNPVIRVDNNIASLGPKDEELKGRQLLSLPPFSYSCPLPGKNNEAARVTAIIWLKHYFAEIDSLVIYRHFQRGQVLRECLEDGDPSEGKHHCMFIHPLKKVGANEVMKNGLQIYVPVSICESKISKRYDTIPSGTLHPNADEIDYLRRLVMYKDSAIIVLNKPPKLPVKGNLPVHNSMDALAAAALSFGYDEGPKLVHRLDRESSGIILMGRTDESFKRLRSLFNYGSNGLTSESTGDRCKGAIRKYWALVIGSPKEKQGLISAPLSKVLLNDGKTERLILAYNSSLDGAQEAITEYRVLGPTINGCSWIELCPLTGRKHQLRVHCAEALGTPIVGDYKYGWYVHKCWKQMPRADFDPETGKPYKMRRHHNLAVQKGSVLSKVPLLHLHCRELVIPNIEKYFEKSQDANKPMKCKSKQDVLRFVAPMPSHMKISWNVMSSCLV